MSNRRIGALAMVGVAGAIALAPTARAAGKEETRTHPQTPPPKTVTINNQVGSITVRHGDPGRLVATKHWNVREPTVTVKRTGDALTADATCPPDSLNNCRVDLTLTLPDPFQLEAALDVGEIDVDGVQGSTQRLRLDVGDLRVARITAEVLTVEAGAGEVTLQEVRATRVVASVDNGDLNVDSAIAPDSVEAHGDNGSIEVAVPAGAYAIELEVGNGDKDVRGLQVDPAAPRTITASADNGSILVRARDGTVRSPPPVATTRGSHDRENGLSVSTADDSGGSGGIGTVALVALLAAVALAATMARRALRRARTR